MKYKITIMTHAEWDAWVKEAFTAMHVNDEPIGELGDLFSSVRVALLDVAKRGSESEMTESEIDGVAAAIASKGMTVVVLPCDGNDKPIVYSNINAEKRAAAKAEKMVMDVMTGVRSAMAGVIDTIESIGNSIVDRSGVRGHTLSTKYDCKDAKSLHILSRTFDAVNQMAGNYAKGTSILKKRSDLQKLNLKSADEFIAALRPRTAA